MVYIREAHPEDGWQVGANKRDRVIYKKPKTMDERGSVASECVKKLELSMPCVLDRLDNAVDKAYGGWPDRLYVIDTKGNVTYRSGPGPWGFKLPDMVAALKKLLPGNPGN